VGLALRAQDGRLHWRADAPPAPDLLARLRQHKADLLELLTEVDERAGILEFDGGVPREQAEAQAVVEVWPASRPGRRHDHARAP
jgi:hypothetical protein